MNKEIKSMFIDDSLSSLSIFTKLNASELKTISKFIKPVHIKKDEAIFAEGEAGERMFVIVSGNMGVFGTQSDGTLRKLFENKAGSFFGEMSIITHEPRAATIIAMEDSKLIMLSKKDFYRIISKYPVIGFKILRTIGIVQNQWLNQSAKSYNDLIRWGESARRRAITDELTGLYNRNFLEESTRERFSNQSMSLRVMSMLMMDLDRIHGINDRYGSKAGDLVIIAAAETINACLRPGDIPSRLAGDEFAILLPDTDSENAARVAERIRESIEKRRIEVPAGAGSSENTIITTHTSIGIALAPIHARTAEDLMETSDIALRKAKELGRNRIEVFA